MSVIVGIILFLVFTFFGELYLRSYGPTQEVLDQANGYLFWMRFTILILPIQMLIANMVYSDGDLNITDATCIQRHLAEIPVYEYIEETADTDGDGQVSIIDVTMIQRYLAQLPCPEGIGEVIK